VEFLLSKCEALSSNTSTARKYQIRFGQSHKHFTRGIQMVVKHKKIFSTSLAISEMQIKPHSDIYQNEYNNTNAGEMQRNGHIYTAGGSLQ
jgi:hypothetical protein